MKIKYFVKKVCEKIASIKLEIEYRNNPTLRKFDEYTKKLIEYNLKNPPQKTTDQMMKELRG